MLCILVFENYRSGLRNGIGDDAAEWPFIWLIINHLSIYSYLLKYGHIPARAVAVLKIILGWGLWLPASLVCLFWYSPLSVALAMFWRADFGILLSMVGWYVL